MVLFETKFKLIVVGFAKKYYCIGGPLIKEKRPVAVIYWSMCAIKVSLVVWSEVPINKVSSVKSMSSNRSWFASKSKSV